MARYSLICLLSLALMALSTHGGRVAEAAPVFTITLSTSSVSFPDQDPDLFPLSQQTGAPVRITLSTKNLAPSQAYSCKALARGDLMSGAATIPISNITWTAVTVAKDPGESFFNGALSKITAVMVAQGFGNNASTSPLTGDLTFSIQNLWTYATGNYSQVVDFTLSSP